MIKTRTENLHHTVINQKLVGVALFMSEKKMDFKIKSISRNQS
jgi:hypothetical protein